MIAAASGVFLNMCFPECLMVKKAGAVAPCRSIVSAMPAVA
jgi:hypothetical protein